MAAFPGTVLGTETEPALMTACRPAWAQRTFPNELLTGELDMIYSVLLLAAMTEWVEVGLNPSPAARTLQAARKLFAPREEEIC